MASYLTRMLSFSLEMDTQRLKARHNGCTGSLDDDNACKNSNLGIGQKDVSDGTLHESKRLEEGPLKFGAKDGICADLNDSDNDFPDAGGGVEATALDPSRIVVSGHSSHVENLNGPLSNEVKPQVSMLEDTGDPAEYKHGGCVQHFNGFREVSCGLQDVPSVSGDNGIALSCSSDASTQDSGSSSVDKDIPSENSKENLGGHSLDTNYYFNASLQADISVMCLYDCCSECLVNLQNFLLRIINSEWRLKGRDSTVDGVHDFVASFSVNLHIAVSKLPAKSCVYSCNRKWEQDPGCQKIDMPQ